MSQNTVATVWSSAKRFLEGVLSQDVFLRWISVITPESLENDVLTLSIENDFFKTWIEENYLSLIQKAVCMSVETPVSLRLIVDASHAPEPLPEPPKRRLPDASAPKRHRTQLKAQSTFGSFIIGPSNSFAHAAAFAVAQAPAKAYNPLFIYGDVGLGKTHLMEAIGNYAQEHHPRLNVTYVSTEQFLNEYIDALGQNATVRFRSKYRKADVLLIDDIHFLGKKERLQEEFFHTFNALYNAHKQIVLTSDRPVSEIVGLERRLVSRFEWGLVSELEAPDLETRIAILRHKQKEMPHQLDPRLLNFIAERIGSNIRRLEGALIRAVSYSSLTGQRLTLDSLEHLLRDSLDQEKEEALTFDVIQRAVCEHYDVRLSDMTSARRPRNIAMPRQVAMYLCRRLTRASLPEIAVAFSKTHATILHADRSIHNRMDVDEEIRTDVRKIARKLGKAMV